MANENLRTAVRGGVLLPGDPDFDRAAQPWNTAVTQSVAAVVEAADAADVAAVLEYAADTGRAVVTQPTGHGATGDIDDAILLRTGRFDSVDIDAERRVARVGSGVRWGQVQAAAAAHGLTGLAGSNPVVGVTGYTLGGGFGWFARKYGWAADAVRAVEIVDAAGRAQRVTADSDPELFWALRGGGGDFAIVTAWELELFPLPQLYGGRVMWSAERSREVFDLFTELTDDAPAELSVWLQRYEIPGMAPTVALDFAYLGDPAQGRRHTARLDSLDGVIADTRGPLTPAEIGRITAEPTDPSPSLSRGELLTDLDDAVVKTLIDEPVAPLLNIQIRGLGGALARPLPDGGARGPVTEPYALYLLGLGLPHLLGDIDKRFGEITDALGSHITGAKPYTFLAPGESAAAAFDADTLARLREIKRNRDPHNVIRANFPVLG
ncbi:FAD-binding oxidoreductase [Nocardia pseudobrasiliensis]|uniref:FAD/FMN-containing dehydrogenase n=1 Tax=Nocardia pseudobrasiliensis TaxID=45979 RepID=A0A370I9Q4_9NOCA|nr:FAD-binding oxidoreductase [Nocardia pseudobrasiliensis]RDI67418.1 FAD/FMN-containing dehydrogenase [Nocardia pseudobrasiliensis]